MNLIWLNSPLPLINSSYYQFQKLKEAGSIAFQISVLLEAAEKVHKDSAEVMARPVNTTSVQVNLMKKLNII
ncbi:MAG: hypothetical protein H6622_13960 [Halobacteriovoraceae bacterium]|nr:hypothetical protein [Halobacteriovoraceae bacterium]